MDKDPSAIEVVDQEPEAEPFPPDVMANPARARMPLERGGRTMKFKVPTADGEMKLYVTTGVYPSGRLGEVFIKADKAGSFASGALDAMAMAVSVGLQHGVPLRAYTDKLIGMQFEPRGFTGSPEFPQCKSVLDLVGRYLHERFEPKP